MRGYLLRSTSLWKNFPSVSTTSIVFLVKGPEENRITNRRKVYKHKLGNTTIPFFLFLHAYACLYMSGHTCTGAYTCVWRQNCTSGIFFLSLHFIEVRSVVQPVTPWCCLVLLQGRLALPLVLWDYRIYK